jgi:hypothetical protein
VFVIRISICWALSAARHLTVTGRERSIVCNFTAFKSLGSTGNSIDGANLPTSLQPSPVISYFPGARKSMSPRP